MSNDKEYQCQSNAFDWAYFKSHGISNQQVVYNELVRVFNTLAWFATDNRMHLPLTITITREDMYGLSKFQASVIGGDDKVITETPK